MDGTTIRKDGITTHRCTACGKRFPGTGKRGRPPNHCPACKAKAEAREAAKAEK